MWENTESTEMGAAAAMPCYAGVPSEIVQQCERAHIVSKALRLEALRKVRDWLAPYGAFKQWCIDHEENYGAIQYQLGQAYGNRSERPMKETTSAAWLDAPDAATIQAQDERIRALEAQLALYRARSAAEWAAEAQRQEAEAARQREVDDWYLRVFAALAHADPTLYGAVMTNHLTLFEAMMRLTGRIALGAVTPLIDLDMGNLYTPVLTSLLAESATPAGKTPLDAETRLAIAGKLTWAARWLRDVGITTEAELAAWSTPERARVFTLDIWAAEPLIMPSQAEIFGSTVTAAKPQE